MGGIGRLQGSATQWNDLFVPANAINPAGSATAATIHVESGMLSFSGSADNTIAGSIQLPHNWKEGSTISPHMHLIFPNSSATNTRWKIEYETANINSDFANALGTYANTETITVANPQAATKHVLGEFTDIVMTGYTMSCILLYRITRLAASDAADTDTNLVYLLSFDVHYEIDSIGSEEEYVK